MVIYGAVHTVFLLLYIRAYRKREELELSELEVDITRSSMVSILLVMCVGLTPILIAALGGVNYATWSGWVYLAIIPMRSIRRLITRRLARARQEKLAAKTQPGACK